MILFHSSGQTDRQRQMDRRTDRDRQTETDGQTETDRWTDGQTETDGQTKIRTCRRLSEFVSKKHSLHGQKDSGLVMDAMEEWASAM